MKMSWALPLALAAMTVSGIAIAQDSSSASETVTLLSQTGEVRSIRSRDNTITLRPGGVFITPEGWSRGEIGEGSMVTIRYTVEGDQKIAVSIVKAY